MAGPIRISVLADGSSARRELEGVSKTSSRMGATLAKVGKVAAVGLAAGIGAAAVAAGKFAQAAAEDQQAAAQMAKTFQNAAGATKGQIAATEDWISAQGKAFGVADDDLRPALSRLVTATKDVGQAQKLTSLAMDVSAGTGKSLEQVSTALMKAQNGQVSSLSRLGINTKNAAGETISMAEATRRMGETFGGSAATQADTLQGRMDRLKLMLSEAGESIGYKLLPPLLAFAEYVQSTVIPKVSELGGYAAELAGKFAPVIEAVRGAFSAFDGSEQAGGKMQQLRDVVAQAWEAISSVFSSTVSIIQSLWQAFGSTIVSYAEASFSNIVRIIGGALDVIQGIFKVAAGILKGDWSQVWDGIKQIVNGAWNVIRGVVEQGWNAIKTIFSAGVTVLKGVWGELWDGIKSLASSALGAVRGIIDRGWDTVKTVTSTAWNSLKGVVATAWDAIKDAVRDGVGGAIDLVREVPGKAKDALGNLGSVLTEAGKALMRGLVAGIEAGIQWVKNKLAEVTDLIPDWKGPRERDKRLLRPAGQLIMGGLVAGIQDGSRGVRTALGGVTDMIEGAVGGQAVRVQYAAPGLSFQPMADARGAAQRATVGQAPRGSAAASAAALSEQAIREQTEELAALAVRQGQALRELAAEVRDLREDNRRTPAEIARQVQALVRTDSR